MKTSVPTKVKHPNKGSFEDLEDDTFGRMLWNPAMLNRAIPKDNSKVRKMRSR
ncbi:hypothetical protein HUK80_12900 [Flavobacterium sp. MAH-1]|uniref:Uncharacterized protein n=1 Tax=Flavobacterium agri TaxID=2743471 RepID=A0A7Y9C7V7_9FLAO|nr:hypothetical protein [Flavobacterium agri]NUY81799.1 hypothetical protein [Flavobacterium agri]NYA71823.1 hypothetical protein [Flavobacterium agri]